MVLVIRELRRDERGVASTVGTIMSLLVFLTFLSLIINQYVPVWMKDSEAAHMNTALGQFGSLKGAIDLQVLSAQMAQNSGTPFLPTTTSSAITLGLDGFPIFSSATVGQLASFPDQGPWNVSFSYLIGTTAVRVWQNSSGQVDLNANNRYYIPEHIVYENGAVLRSQTDGQVIRAPNTFLVSKSGNKTSLAFELVGIYGVGSVSGTTTEVVNTKVFGTSLQVYNNLATALTITHSSLYGLAWYTFMNQTLAQGFGLARGQGTFFQDFLTISFQSAYYSIRANYDPVSGIYAMTLVVANVPNVSSITSFTLQQAFVQIGIGEESSTNL